MAEDELAVSVIAALRGAGSAERAVKEKAYLKSDLEFLGVSVPALRAIVRGALKTQPVRDRAALLAAVTALWQPPVHEARMAAVDLLVFRGGLLAAEDMALIERLLRESKTWALVDTLAVRVAGPLVAREPALNATLDRWAADADFWLRRAALLALLMPLRAGGGDFARFSRYADAMLEEREFFIRKAIGWVLREVSKKRPNLVSAWLAPRTQRISGVTRREAERYLGYR